MQMCSPASFVLTETNVYFSKTSNSHEEIIREHKLPDGLTSVAASFREPLILRVEIVPPADDYTTDPATWLYEVDQDQLPAWADGAEARARAVLPEWLKYHCQHQTGQNLDGGDCMLQVSGHGAIQKAGNDALQKAGDCSIQVAASNAKQIAGSQSSQTAEGCATQKADYHATQMAGCLAIQTAGDAANQVAANHANQTAGGDSTQHAGDNSMQTAIGRVKQWAGDFATQTAGRSATQVAGDYSIQTAKNFANQTAGAHSTQTAGDDSTQKAGVGTVQIARWWDDGEWHVATRVVTEAEAGKPYHVYDGVWSLETKNELA
jgi:hypothetical protein